MVDGVEVAMLAYNSMVLLTELTMKFNRRTFVLAVAAVCVAVGSAGAQSLAMTLAGIQSPDQKTRLRSGNQLWDYYRGHPQSVCAPSAAPDVKRQLIAALERENEWLQSSAPKPAPVDENGNPSDGEAESEFYATLIGCVGALKDARSVRALVGAIDTGRGATDPLLAMGEPAIKEVIKIVNDPAKDGTKRDAAIRVLGRFAGATGTVRASESNRQMIRQALLPVLNGRDDFARRQAIGSLQTFSDPELQATINRIAESDSGEVVGSRRVYPTRDAARQWIKADSLKRSRRP
jgi:hypothetical protein